jgi:hypothetical protein
VTTSPTDNGKAMAARVPPLLTLLPHQQDGADTVADARKRQRNVLKQLKRSSANGFQIAGLKRCSPKRCGKERCREVCAFGTRNHRLKAGPAAYNLLEKHDGPFFEVRVSPDVWLRKAGELHKASMLAVRKLNRRALDAHYNTNAVAVGLLKVSALPEHLPADWRLEMHQIVAGIERETLERIFTNQKPNAYNVVRIDPIENLVDAVTRVFRQDLRVWQYPSDTNEPAQPKKSLRAEYYRWLLSINAGALSIRYGCDRHFNKLNKQPRPVRIKMRKGHPYPEWLEYNQFGSETREKRDLYEEMHPKGKITTGSTKDYLDE